MWPTMATPCSSREKSFTATTATSTVASDPGTAGTYRLRSITSASEAAPTPSVTRLVSSRLRTMSHAFSKKSPSPPSIPNSLGTCPMMITSAMPTMKPLSTGSDTKLEMNPRRSRPAARATRPVMTARAAVSAATLPSVATPATAVAERAAVADIGPTTRCRELPKRA